MFVLSFVCTAVPVDTITNPTIQDHGAAHLDQTIGGEIDSCDKSAYPQ
jgi:hypothetical protein